jgi:hypothetical protein
MSIYLSTDYRAEVDDTGVITVRQRTPAVVQKMSPTPDGALRVERLTLENAKTEADRHLMEGVEASILLEAKRVGNRYWEVDEDHGAQRFHGVRTDGVLKKYFLNMGFSEDTLHELWRECMALPKHRSYWTIGQRRKRCVRAR